MGTGIHGITRVRLDPGEEVLAGELAEQYGPLVDLYVGNFAYYLDAGTVSGDICDELPGDTARGELSIDETPVVGNAVLFDITNHGTSTVHLVPDRIAELTDAHSSRAVTVFTGAMTAEARPSNEVAPGGTHTVRAALSFAACDATNGSDLVAGTYEAALVIRVFDQPAWEGDPTDEILIARYAIDIP